MFRNFFKTTFRSLLKNKTYSLLNIFGLTIGIACAALIFLWVEDELTPDHNNQKKDRLYLVKMNNDVDNGVFTHSSTPGLLGPSIQQELPGIANTCRTTEEGTTLLFTNGDKSVYASGTYAEPSLFKMFTLPFKEGSAETAFTQLYSIVLTEKTARKFFGDEKNIVGKTIRVDNKQDYVVSGILRDLPENATLQFEWLAPFQIIYLDNPGISRWTDFGTTTYVELKPGVHPETLNQKLFNYIQEKQGSKSSTSHAFLFAMNDWRLYNDFDNGKKTGSGRIQYVRLFTTIAWIILFIACINFMNLATARSEKRAREVGVRKVLGAGRKMLVFQFLTDALFMAFIAALFSVLVVTLLLPAFNLLVQKNLSAGYSSPAHIGALCFLILICGLLAGSYPALYLSSFNPVYVLKGIKIKTGSAAFIRKGLVVIQFSISIILIIGTIIIYQQIQHVKTRNLGFTKENLIQMSVQGDMAQNFASIKQDLINTNVVENAALADHVTIAGGNNSTGISWQGKDPNSMVVISHRLVSPEFMSTMGMHMVEGRDFRSTDIVSFYNDGKPKNPSSVFNVIVTESMEKLLGKGSAIGKILERQTDDGILKLLITGVIKDYVYGNMYGNASPVVFYCIPEAARLMYVRTKRNADPSLVLTKLESVMKKDNGAYPFEYKFVDDQFNERFLSEMLIGKLSRVFASLAIIISCLGLFGLAAYTAERRTREIGIRKVLGASVSGISALLSKDFLKLVGFSCVIAFPVAWLLMQKWLQNYQYRIEISWWIFLLAGLSAMFIASFTISFQAIKSAIANPVKSLRAE
jgi:putative ABC transport system permease protein